MDLVSAPDAGVITNEAVAELRSRIGQTIPQSGSPYLTETSYDAVRHWVNGVGDMNPLWTDEVHAKQSPWGTTLCPPTILYAFGRYSVGYRGGLPGIHSMFGGSEWNWHRPIKWGEKIKNAAKFVDLVERPSKFAGKSFQQISEVIFQTDAGETVASGRAWAFRTERKRAAGNGKYQGVSIKKYSREEMEAIAESYRTEFIRGKQTLYLEDVKTGEKLPTIVRGPYTVTTAIAFLQGWGGVFVRSHGQAMAYYDQHPKAGLVNDFGALEPPEAVHWDSDLARRVGVAAAYDYGPERISWISTLLTNWIGDAGFLEYLRVELRRHNIIGDLITCRATVTSIASDKGCVELDVWAENQNSELVAKGTARVALPLRAKSEKRAPIPADMK